MIQIEHDFILPHLYHSVRVPTTVFDELQQATTLPRIQEWLLAVPPWLQVQSVRTIVADQLNSLDPGERDAIQLALIDKADLVLIDERKGRVMAHHFGLETTGTLGVILEAHRKHLTDGVNAFERLQKHTNFRLSRQLAEDFYRILRQSI